jgi:hypothetical protein
MYSIQGFLTCQWKLPTKYKHLSQVERYQIYALMKAGAPDPKNLTIYK